jgi:anti-sigma regulatory factor (Ser/Thr protein kinase)
MKHSLDAIAFSGEMVVRTETMGLSAARNRIVSVARGLQFSREEVDDVLLAVGEAVTNAYVHGTPEPGTSLIYLGWHCDGDVLTVTVRDEGFNEHNANHVPLSRQHVKLLGQGIQLMRRVMDDVDIHFDGGATVILKKQKLGVRS